MRLLRPFNAKVVRILAPNQLGTSPNSDVLTITMTSSGLVWNGFGQYAGFRITNQTSTGTITVREGPDSSFPIIHQQSSPTTGLYYYTLGVLADNTASYRSSASIYITLGGTGQTVEVFVYDPE